MKKFWNFIDNWGVSISGGMILLSILSGGLYSAEIVSVGMPITMFSITAILIALSIYRMIKV